jgi:hypothetical protein
MKTGKAFQAGIIGAVAMSVLMFLARSVLSIPANLEMILGTIFTAPGNTAWMIGFVMHLVISGCIALLYAYGFENVTHRAGWAVGAGLGSMHAIVAGIFMGMIGSIHPRMPDPIMPPGAFFSNMGAMGVVEMFVLYLVFGAIVGHLYAPVLKPVR